MFKMISSTRVQSKGTTKAQIFNPRLHMLSDSIINVFMMILFLIGLKDMREEMITFYFSILILFSCNLMVLPCSARM